MRRLYRLVGVAAHKGLCALPLLALTVRAETGLVREYVQTNEIPMRVSETPLVVGANYETSVAPVFAGYIFTHWTMNVEGTTRDVWGRAYDAVPYRLEGRIDFTAHYLPADQDTDGDGVADGHEIYWYGNLAQGADSDTDGDGFTFAEELVNGTNPLIAEGEEEGPIQFADGEMTLYNPNGYGRIVVRSDTEGLVTPRDEAYRPGTAVTTGALSPTTSTFAYWLRNGEPCRDAWGRAMDEIAFTFGEASEEFVAVGVADADERMKLYWYGTTDIAMDCDTDGDGRTFAEEIAAGTNPLMADADVEGPVRYGDGELTLYNPFDYQPAVMTTRNGGTVTTNSCEYLRPGTVVTTSAGSPSSSTFAYWTRNGEPCRDAWGRALDQISFSMGTQLETLEAVQVADADERMKLYWYGTTEVAMESDTDGDGLTFAEEIAAGTNPLMADADVEGPVQVADGRLVMLDPEGTLDWCVATTEGYEGVYDGQEHGISLQVVVPQSGARVLYARSDAGPFAATMPTFKDAGTYEVWYEVSADDYETEVNSAMVVITLKQLSSGMVVAPADVVETGEALTPKPTVTDGTAVLTESVDYTCTYADNVQPGTAKVTVSGKGNYMGSVQTTFEIKSAKAEKLREIFDGLGEVTPDGDGWKVTLTNDVGGTVEIGDNLGPVTLDLKGRNLIGAAGTTGDAVSVPGGDGAPAIRIAATGEDGNPTVLTIVDSVPDDTDDVIGGRGGDGTPGGNGGAGVEVVGGVREGVKINVGVSVGIRGGRGGDDLNGNTHGGNGGAGVDGDVGTNDGSISGGEGGDSEHGRGGDGGKGVTGDVDDNNGTITGGDGGDSVDGTGGDGGSGVGGDIGNNDGEISGGEGGHSETGDDGEHGVGGEGDIGGGTGTIVKVEVPVPVEATVTKTYAGKPLKVDVEDTERYAVSGNDGWTNIGGPHTVTLTLKDPVRYCWKGVAGDTITSALTIVVKEITDEMVQPCVDAFFFDGDAKKPTVDVIYEVDGKDICTESDYTLVYGTKVAAGWWVTVAGKGNYSGTVTKIVPVLKRPVAPPIVPSMSYNGRTQKPTIPTDERWTVVANPGGINVGEYANVVLRLTNTTDYKWKGGAEDQTDITLVFKITKGNNGWSRQPGMKGWAYGETPSEPSMGQARYGTVRVAYRKAGADVSTETATRPELPGKYVARFWVDESASYIGVAVHEPYMDIAFEITGTAPGGDHTTTTPVPVPHDWLDAYVAEFGGGDYEAAGNAKGKNGVALWESYVAGLDPTDATSQFKAIITMGANGEPSITWEPDMSKADPPRTYTTYGKANLLDKAWTPVTDANRAAMRFFKVGVEIK